MPNAAFGALPYAEEVQVGEAGVESENPHIAQHNLQPILQHGPHPELLAIEYPIAHIEQPAHIINLLDDVEEEGHMAVNPPNIRNLSLKDLPTFGGYPYENASQFVQQFENYTQIYGWTEEFKLKHFKLALTHNAASWLYNLEKKTEEQRAPVANVPVSANAPVGPLYTWEELNDNFIKTFGKTYIDYDLMGKSGRMKFAEDPLSYVLNMLTYLNETSPHASEKDKIKHLVGGSLPI